jgi:hypothetical protein
MIALEFDGSVFERKAEQLNAAIDQVPYALSRTLNDAAFDTRNKLINETWPQHVKVRNPGFMRAALNIERSDKTHLEVHIKDVLGGGNLYLHAHGGTIQAKKNSLAVAIEPNVTRGAHGVKKDQWPRSLVATTPKRAVRVTQRGLFIGQHGTLRLMYKLQPTITMRKDVPFVEDYQRFMREAIDDLFPSHLAQAMATRKA